MEKINWLDIFENLNIEEEEKIESYITTTLEQKKNYFSKASFSLTIQYLRNFKKETHLLSNNRRIEYINSLDIPPPKVGMSESALFNQTVFEAQQNYYEFINSYKYMLISKRQLQDNISIYDLTPEDFYNHSRNEFIKHGMLFSETQFQADQLERLELLAEKYRNGIKNNIPVKISQNQFIKIKQYIQYFETLKQPKKKWIKLELSHKLTIAGIFLSIIVLLWGNNIIGRWRESDEIKKDNSQTINVTPLVIEQKKDTVDTPKTENVKVKSIEIVQIDSSEKFDNVVPIDSSLKINNDKEKVYGFLLNYLSTRNGRNADAHQFFADEVDQYYLVYDVTPDRINILDQADIDYVDKKYTMKKETLELVSKEDNISYWKFHGNFSCYRPSLKKYQNGRIEMEYGINDEQKITKIKLLDHKEYYTIGKPF
jgi:hypothetical protein